MIIRFHYNTVQKMWPRAELLFTDTDSLMYWVETEDAYKDMSAQKELFDFASYSKTSPFYDPTNNKVYPPCTQPPHQSYAPLPQFPNTYY